MRKFVIAAAIVAASLVGGIASGQARQISFWGHTFDAPDSASPTDFVAPPPVRDFNAQVEHRERYNRHSRQRIEMDLR